MKKYFSLTCIWMLSAVSGLFISSVATPKVDPLDEHGFNLQTSWRGESFPLISLEKIEFILEKRLELFPKSNLRKLAQHFHSLCLIHKFDPAFILGLIEVESGFDRRALSEQGAVGLMQLMRPTADFVLRKLSIQSTGYETFSTTHLLKKSLTSEMLTDPFLNISIGMKYLSWLREAYKSRGSSYDMLAAYNLGPAKMNQLLENKYFKPVETKKYFFMVSRAALGFRYEASKVF